MSWRIIYISEAEEMRLYLDNLKVLKGEQEVLIPLADIHTIMIDNQYTTITARLLNKLTEYHILAVFCDEQHHPNLFCVGLYSHYKVYGMLHKQIKWEQTIKDEIWAEIIRIKIQNQISVLNFYDKDIKVAKKMKAHSSHVEPGDPTNREGLAASIYFKELFYKSFTREREAVDTYNAGLNYGYIVLRACIARSVVAHGLHPAFGVGHRNQYNAFNLVDDIIEVFRPIIDYWVYSSLDEGDFLTRECKQNIVKQMSKKVKIGGQHQTVLNAINIFVQSFIRVIEEDDIGRLVYPENGITI